MRFRKSEADPATKEAKAVTASAKAASKAAAASETSAASSDNLTPDESGVKNNYSDMNWTSEVPSLCIVNLKDRGPSSEGTAMNASCMS